MKDLREFIKQVEALDELKLVNNASWDIELGTITALSIESEKTPAILFDEIEGYPKGFRVLVNSLHSIARIALALNLHSHSKPVEYVKELKERWENMKLMPPKVVKDGPVMENIMQGDDIDVFRFPAPRWHEHDGGRYIGTGSVTITKDPDDGYVNLGTYRIMIQNRDTLSFYASPGKHARIIREKFYAKGAPCKVAISLGHSPELLIAGGTPLPAGFSEYDFIGGLTGEPVEVIKGSYAGLPIPAHSEIVIEGESIPGEKMPEGPFGEWTGYYASGTREEPTIRIKSIMYRDNPILLGAPPQRPRRTGSKPGSANFLRSTELWHHLEQLGIPGIAGVWMHYGTYMIVVSIKQLFDGHDKQAALGVLGSRAGAFHGRYVIVVDEDIDPSDLDDVLWAICTRSDPALSLDIVHRCWSTPLDPMVPKGNKPINSRAIICACKPFERINEFPLAIEVSQQERERYQRKWKNILNL